MGHRTAAGVVLVGLLASLATAWDGPPRTVQGVVRDAAGSPVAGAAVTLEVGRVQLAITDEPDRWDSVRTDRTTSDAAGAFRFEGVPEGATLVVWAKTADGFASAPATGDVALTLAPLASVSGRVTGRARHLEGLRARVAGGGGLAAAEGAVDEDTGRFDVRGVVPGEGVLRIRRGTFDLAHCPVSVSPGAEAKVKSLRVTGDFLPDADPLVDVLKVRLVDASGRPVRDVQFVWSSQWMDGGTSSDEDGVVRLAGGGVAIGGPPYRLRLRALQSEGGAWRGVLAGVRGGTATVTLDPLVEVTGTVSLGGRALDPYRLHAVADDRPVRLRTASVEKGRYSIRLPPGRSRLVVATVDGTLHEASLDVAGSTGPQMHDVVLR